MLDINVNNFLNNVGDKNNFMLSIKCTFHIPLINRVSYRRNSRTVMLYIFL